MSDKKLVLVTGVTGYIAGHVVNNFLEAGYRVRGTTRGSKTQQLRDSVKVEGLEFVQVDDIASSDMSEALKGVYAVIHVASPMPWQVDVDENMRSAVEGTLHILREAIKAGIEKVVVTSSFGALLEPDMIRGFSGETFTGAEWGTVTMEEVRAKAEDTVYVYFASKIFAERALWKFAAEHPQLDIATIQPGFVYGPYAKHFPFPSPTSGTNGFIYGLAQGQQPPVIPPAVVDVRDVAKAHVLALARPRSSKLEDKRYLVNGGLFTWKQAAAALLEARPQYKTLKPEEITELPGKASIWDTSKTERELGMKFIESRFTIIDGADSAMEAAAALKAKAA
jgi:nucleoside-diphosphate-sugar epimerase